jgi:predicted Zn-dependent protease
MTIHRIWLVPVFLALGACATSPTGQPQLRLFPDSEMVRMGAAAFEQSKQETPLTRNDAATRYVRCVAAAVVAEVGLPGEWEVQVFESPQANAFALPGAKIGVYTGMLKVAESQDQLAAVLSHEVAHVTAQHGNARVSAASATRVGLDLVQVLTSTSTPYRTELLGLLGLGAQYGVLLPYGRGQETEADILGLDYMAMAGFDPRQAIQLWRNMAVASGGKQPPAFLSTHPSNEGRITALSERMPDAMKRYRTARARGKRPQCR